MRTGIVVLLLLAAALPLAQGLALPPVAGSVPAPAPEAPAARAAAPAGEQIDFSCPSAVQQVSTEPVDCPTYVIDLEDLFGQPDLMVDPRMPNIMAFSAIHGGRGLHPLPNDQPPTERSRQNLVHQPHTTFTTKDGGRQWTDQPYDAPGVASQPGGLPGAASTRDVYGEDNAGAMDGDGRVDLAALYSEKTGAGSYRYFVALWRQDRADKGMDYNANVRIVDVPAGSKADDLHMTYVPETDTVVALWRQEDAQDASAIAGAWAAGKEKGLWHDIDANATLTGCGGISRPFADATRVLFACAAGPGAPGPARIRGFDTPNMTLVDEGAIPLPGAGQVTLAPLTGTGLYGAVETGISDGRPSVLATFGANASGWSSPVQLARDLTRGDAPATPLLEARMTAATYMPLSGNLHLIYEERYDVGAGASKPAIYKALVSVQARGGTQAAVDLKLGTVQRVDTTPQYTGVGDGAYDDLHDSIVLWTGEDGAPKEFVAFGDYGFVRFAQVQERDFAPPLVPLAVQAPPIPVASAGTVPALVGLPAGILAGAAMTRVALAKRKVTTEARDE